MVSCILALGSNLGERAGTLQAAVDALDATAGIKVVRTSDTAVTKPVGGPEGQPDFLNLVLRVTTTLAPLQLLAACQQIEAAHDRTREVRWGPRTLDIDVITYGDQTSNDPVLTLPHPRAATRGFVLAGTPVAQLAAAAADTPGIKRAEAGA